MSRINTRFRALAIISLATVVLLTALSAEATLATDPVPSPAPSASASPTPSLDPAASPAPTTDPSTTPVASSDPVAAPNADPTATAAVVATPAQPEVPLAAVVTAYARSHLRARYAHGSTGPRAFDCSGLMWRVFHEAHLGGKVSSTSARAIYLSYRRRGLASRSHPKVGDLVVWGRGSHVGLYIGRGYAISALTQGVRVHRVNALFTPFTAYLHTRLSRVEVPAWRLLVATHVRSLRHMVASATLRAGPSSGTAALRTLSRGTRLVRLGTARDASGHAWYRILTLRGRIGWLPASIVRR